MPEVDSGQKVKKTLFYVCTFFRYIIIMYHSIYLFIRTKCESKDMIDIFRADRQKGMSAFKRLSTKEVPRWVVERMTNDHQKYDDD